MLSHIACFFLGVGATLAAIFLWIRCDIGDPLDPRDDIHSDYSEPERPVSAGLGGRRHAGGSAETAQSSQREKSAKFPPRRA